MSKTDPTQFSDVFLATCVDEYMKRVIRRARVMEYNDNIEVSVDASQYRRDSDYEITHTVSFGYNKPSIKGNNCLHAVDRLVNRWREDQDLAPVTVTVMLPPPAPSPEVIEDGEFSDAF